MAVRRRSGSLGTPCSAHCLLPLHWREHGERAQLLLTGPAPSRYQVMLQSKGNALLEAGMEIPMEISIPFLSGAHLTSTPKAPVSCCSSSHGPLRSGNYCSSLGKWDLHLCFSYSYASTAKRSKGAGEEGMRRLPSQKQVTPAVHAAGARWP